MLLKHQQKEFRTISTVNCLTNSNKTTLNNFSGSTLSLIGGISLISIPKIKIEISFDEFDKDLDLLDIISETYSSTNQSSSSPSSSSSSFSSTSPTTCSSISLLSLIEEELSNSSYKICDMEIDTNDLRNTLDYCMHHNKTICQGCFTIGCNGCIQCSLCESLIEIGNQERDPYSSLDDNELYHGVCIQQYCHNN